MKNASSSTCTSTAMHRQKRLSNFNQETTKTISINSEKTSSHKTVQRQFVFEEQNNSICGTKISKCVTILRALNHSLRQRIIELLDENADMTVQSLSFSLRVEHSVVSQHLSILRRIEVVLFKRSGKYIHYSINTSRMQELKRMIGVLST